MEWNLWKLYDANPFCKKSQSSVSQKGNSSMLASIPISGVASTISAAEIIEQIKALPPEERAEVTKFVVETDDAWVPEDFKKSMEDLKAGRVFDMELVMSGAEPPPRPAK
jgi:hypothetical protein